MFKEAYEQGEAQAGIDLGFTKEAKNPFPGEEAWKMVSNRFKQVPKKLPKLEGPKMGIDSEGVRTLNYGAPAPKPLVFPEESPLSPKAREAMAAFNHKRG